MAGALAAAEIPRSKLGPARRARLTGPERDFYFWILRRFAAGGRPSAAELRTAARELGVETEGTLRALAREDLVHLGRGGEIAVAYPFSGVTTAHRVRFANGEEVFAMCAIDALGIAPMFDEPVEISSQDPLTGASFHARVTPVGDATWEPESAVVVAGVSDSCGESFRGCCPVLNFFASADNAERWLAAHPEVRGHVATIEDAITAGRAVFGDVLEPR